MSALATPATSGTGSSAPCTTFGRTNPWPTKPSTASGTMALTRAAPANESSNMSSEVPTIAVMPHQISV